MFKHSFACLCLCIALAWPGADAYADINKQQAADIAQQQFEGRVIAVNEDHFEGQRAYRVKILNQQGELHVVVIDVQSGDVLAAH